MHRLRYALAASIAAFTLGTSAFIVAACGGNCAAECVSSAKAMIRMPVPAGGLQNLELEICADDECITGEPTADAPDASDAGQNVIVQAQEGRLQAYGVVIGGPDGIAHVDYFLYGIQRRKPEQSVTIRITGRDRSTKASLFTRESTVKSSNTDVCGDHCGQAEATFVIE